MSAIVANCAINLRCELTKPVKVEYIDGNMFSMDNAGNTAHVYIYYNGQPQEVVGSVSAEVIRPDGGTVAVTGAMSGNRAYVIFPQAVYAIPGTISCVIKITEGTTTTTIAAFVANVYRSSTDQAIDPGQLIPSISSLISAIEAAVGSIPADYSSLLATIAGTYSSSKTYNVGDYAWESGVLKRCIVPITAGETFTAAHLTAVNVGGELSDLKSATNELVRYEVKGAAATATGWRLNESDGFCSSDANYKMVKFVVTAGNKYKIISDDRFQWQNSASVPASGTSNRIGGITYGVGTFYMTAPEGATYLIVSTPTTSAANVYDEKTDRVSRAESAISALESAVTDGDLFKLKESNGYIGSDGSTVISGNVYLFTRMIAVKQNDIFEYSVFASTATLAIAAYESKTDTTAIVSKSIAGNGSITSGLYTVPTGVNFVRVTTQVSYNNPIFRIFTPQNTKSISGGDFNDFAPSLEPYAIFAAESYSNSPVSDPLNTVGILHVYEDVTNHFIWQVFVHKDTDRETTYMRYKNPNSTWNAWVDSGLDKAFEGMALGTNTDLNGLTDVGIYESLNGSFAPETAPDASSNVGVVIVTKDTNSGIVYQMFVESYTGRVFTRIKRASGWDAWAAEPNPHEVSILFVGNSLTQDGIAYLPYLLKTYFPEIKFRFYMWYNGGYTLVEQYAAFTSNAAADIFSVSENTASWTNYSESKTMSTVLSDYKFDVVCMQGYYNYTANTDDETAWNNCRDYIQSHYSGGNPLEFITLFHAPKRSDAETIFNRTKLYNGRIMQNTISQDMIPIGIAVYRALSTSLDSLGDQGHLSPDGTHTQEGLPCLLQTYTALCWLLDKLSINKSVYGFPFKMTTAIYNTINVPGPNLGTGVIEGTDAQNLLAQEIAIKAYKEGKKFVADNIYPGN